VAALGARGPPAGGVRCFARCEWPVGRAWRCCCEGTTAWPRFVALASLLGRRAAVGLGVEVATPPALIVKALLKPMDGATIGGVLEIFARGVRLSTNVNLEAGGPASK
jgi:hypothetical protein